MGATNFDSLIVGGVPFVPGQPGNANIRGQVPGGKVYYVSSTTGSPGNGLSIDAPLTTVFGAKGAVAKIANRTNSGDVIFVLPGHTESISSADHGSHWGTASGFSIVGLGTGTMRPTFTWTTATSTLLLDTANVEIANCNMNLAGAHAAGSALTVAAPITVSGVGCRLVNNFFYWGYDADQIVGTGIIWSGADGVFSGNTAIALVAAAPTETFLRLTAADRIRIVGNYIFGPTAGTTVGVIKGLTTASLNVYVGYNYLHNILASSTIAMSLLTGSTGEIQHNMASVEGNSILPFTASIGRWHQNYCVDAEGLAGALVGTAAT